jgi:hypothetical protein
MIAAMKRFPPNPAQPHRVCWGCELYCAADDLRCGNGSLRTPHPAELFGPDWERWIPGSPPPTDDAAAAVPAAPAAA